MEKIKIIDFTYDIISIKECSSLLEIEFLDTVDFSDIDLSTFDLLTDGGVLCRTFENYTTIYKTDGNKITLSNDGSVYIDHPIIEPNPIDPYVPTPEEIALQLENAKKNKIEESNKKLEMFLLEHPILYSDGNYYSVTLGKQSILQGNLMGYQLELQMGITNPILEWNSTGEICVPWSYDDLSALAIAIKNYVKPYVSAQQAYEKRINSCNTLEEIQGIVINYSVIK